MKSRGAVLFQCIMVSILHGKMSELLIGHCTPTTSALELLLFCNFCILLAYHCAPFCGIIIHAAYDPPHNEMSISGPSQWYELYGTSYMVHVAFKIPCVFCLPVFVFSRTISRGSLNCFLFVLLLSREKFLRFISLSVWHTLLSISFRL